MVTAAIALDGDLSTAWIILPASPALSNLTYLADLSIGLDAGLGNGSACCSCGRAIGRDRALRDTGDRGCSRHRRRRADI